VVTLSFSDTEEVLELLFPNPDHDLVSRVSEPSSCSGSDLFEDWPKAPRGECFHCFDYGCFKLPRFDSQCPTWRSRVSH
jgi:hypothetical protein